MTTLCVIPGCRIRGRHLSECTEDGCRGCLPRVAAYGLTCDPCTDRPRRQLATIIEVAPDARLVGAGLVRRGGGGSGGKAGSRPPLNDAATDTLNDVQNFLTTLARDIAETRGVSVPRSLGQDPIVVAARWLGGQIEWLRHAVDGTQPWAPGAYAEIAECAGRMRGLVNGRSEQRFLGPCGAPTVEDHSVFDGEREWTDLREGPPCQGDVYCHLDAEEGRCNTCGAKWPTAERQAWLDGEVRSHAFRAIEIAEAYGVNVNTIRSWAARDQLKSYWRTQGGIVAEWTEPPEGETRERLHYVGDVLDLAAADAARRATEQAKRARRAAVKAADTERLSA